MKEKQLRPLNEQAPFLRLLFFSLKKKFRFYCVVSTPSAGSVSYRFHFTMADDAGAKFLELFLWHAGENYFTKMQIQFRATQTNETGCEREAQREKETERESDEKHTIRTRSEYKTKCVCVCVCTNTTVILDIVGTKN